MKSSPRPAKAAVAYDETSEDYQLARELARHAVRLRDLGDHEGALAAATAAIEIGHHARLPNTIEKATT